MREKLYVTHTSPASGRRAKFSEEVDSVWLLTVSGSGRPERDCWLFNTPSAPAEPDMEVYRARSSPFRHRPRTSSPAAFDGGSE
jgi:hypothetical protein